MYITSKFELKAELTSRITMFETFNMIYININSLYLLNIVNSNINITTFLVRTLGLYHHCFSSVFI